ncbi:MAG TPA: PAS domain-containing protein, partial [Methanotrichaceae archaeon]|nr:PAS domain-containing protein [Methanotrichaceae archaeon]
MKSLSDPGNAADILSDALEELQLSLKELSSAEESLYESESLLRSFFDSPGIMRGIIEVIADDDVLHIADNEVTAGFLGLTPEAMRNKRGSDLGESREILCTWVGYYRQSQSTGKPVCFEYLDRRGEKEAWLSATVNYLGTVREGKPRFAYIVSDITERRRADKALRESEARLHRFYESGLIGVIYWNMDNLIVDANDKFLEMVGYTREELASGQIDWVNMTPPEYRHLDEYSVKELLATGINRNPFEKEYIRKDGTRVPIIVAGAMLDEARFNGVAFALDITEHKEAEKALRESENRYRSLFENMLEGFAYCKMLYDDQGRPVDFVYLDANSAFQRLTGLADVAGKRATEAIPGIEKSHPELLDIYGRVASTGKPEKFEIEFKPLGIWLSISAYSTERDYFVAVFDNITQRKQAEAEREQLVERLMDSIERAEGDRSQLEAIFAAQSDAVLIYDTEMKIQRVNPSFIEAYGFDPVGLNVKDIIQRVSCRWLDGRPFLWDEQPTPRALRGEKVAGARFLITKADGSEAAVETSSGPIKVEGRITGTVTVWRDITDRVRSEEALKESERREREQAEELATLLDAIPTPVFIAHDPDGTHITGNRAADDLLRNPYGAEASLSAPDAARPSHFRAVKDGRELQTDELPAQRAARGFQVNDFEFSLVFNDDTIRHVVGYGTPLRDDEGRPRGAV